MSGSDEAQGGGQPSDDEDTVEFEIEVVTSSASSISAVSRSSTPARDSNDASPATATGTPKQPPTRPESQAQHVLTPRPDDADLIDQRAPIVGTIKQVALEGALLVGKESQQSGNKWAEPRNDKASLVEEVCAGDEPGFSDDIDILTPPASGHQDGNAAASVGDESRIPVGDLKRQANQEREEEEGEDGEEEEEEEVEYKIVAHTLEASERDEARAATSCQNDLKPETTQECCPDCLSNEAQQPAPQVDKEPSAATDAIDAGNEPSEDLRVDASDKTTSDSCDGCDGQLANERLQCPNGWSLIEAGADLTITHMEPSVFGAGESLAQDDQLSAQATSRTVADLDELALESVSIDGGHDQHSIVADHSDARGADSTMKPAPSIESEARDSFGVAETAAATALCDVPESSRDEVLLEAEELPLVEIGAGALAEPAPCNQELEDKQAAVVSPHDGDAETDGDGFQLVCASQRNSPGIVSINSCSDIQHDSGDSALLALDEARLDKSEEQQAGGGSRLDSASSSTSLHLLNSENIFEEEDLEREFDEEPEFKRREVLIKRNKNPRDEYELGDELGRGKFGTVYKCTELTSGLKLAAKFICMRRREDREDVEREVAIMSVLQHKRLLQLYNAFDDGSQEMCLITELVEGGELFERIVDDDFDLTEKKAAIFMRQICEGVEYMHSQQIVHLDMKPENILCLSRTGMRIKLIDFGLARRLDPNNPIRVLFGTPDFAAPEVLAYETVELATDMWSVGVICYVLLSGLSPFMGDTDMDTMANVMRATFDFNDQAFEAISELAKDFISKLLVRDVNVRLKPSECLKHAWLQRGSAPLERHIRERRESSLSLVLGTHQRLALEQAAMLSAMAFNNNNNSSSSSNNNNNNNNNSNTTSSGPSPSTPPVQSGIPPSTLPNLMAAGARPRHSFGGESTASISHQSLDKRRLKRYVIRRKWHKTVHAIMALGRMGANLKLA